MGTEAALYTLEAASLQPWLPPAPAPHTPVGSDADAAQPAGMHGSQTTAPSAQGGALSLGVPPQDIASAGAVAARQWPISREACRAAAAQLIAPHEGPQGGGFAGSGIAAPGAGALEVHATEFHVEYCELEAMAWLKAGTGSDGSDGHMQQQQQQQQPGGGLEVVGQRDAEDGVLLSSVAAMMEARRQQVMLAPE